MIIYLNSPIEKNEESNHLPSKVQRNSYQMFLEHSSVMNGSWVILPYVPPGVLPKPANQNFIWLFFQIKGLSFQIFGHNFPKASMISEKLERKRVWHSFLLFHLVCFVLLRLQRNL